MRWPRELLQAGRHRRVRLLAALLACAPDALVLADARPPALGAGRGGGKEEQEEQEGSFKASDE